MKELEKLDVKQPVVVFIDENIKVVESEEEYWNWHKILTRRLRKLTTNPKKIIYHPDEFLKEYELIMCEMVARGIVTLEWADEQRQKVYKTLSNPVDFMSWVDKSPKLKKLYEKLKNWKAKKGKDKS